MANVYAVKSGNWSDTTVWNTGALPTSADDVFPNTYTVTIDINAFCKTIGNSAAAGISQGGKFTLNGEITLNLASSSAYAAYSAFGYPINDYLITFNASSPSSSTINGNIGGGYASQNKTILHNGSGTLNINGNVIGPAGGSCEYGYAITLSGSGSLNVIGTVTGGTANYGGTAIFLNGPGTANITGSVLAGSSGYGGGADSNYAIRNTSNGTVNVTGAVSCPTTKPYPAIANASTGIISIVGSIDGGAAGSVSNDNAGTLIHTGTASANANGPAIAAGSMTQNTYLSGPFIGTAAGIVANASYKWRWVSSIGSSYMTVPNFTGTGYKNLYTSDSALSQSGQPAASNVRSGTIYGPASELTGTCAVPAAGSVALGVPIDNTTGTAVLTAANVRTAIGMASANLDTQLDALPTAGENAIAVRTELNTELTRLNNCATVATTGQQIQDALI